MVSGCGSFFNRSDAQLGLISTVDTLEMNENSKEMIQDSVFLYRDNAFFVPRLLRYRVERN